MNVTRLVAFGYQVAAGVHETVVLADLRKRGAVVRR